MIGEFFVLRIHICCGNNKTVFAVEAQVEATPPRTRHTDSSNVRFFIPTVLVNENTW